MGISVIRSMTSFRLLVGAACCAVFMLAGCASNPSAAPGASSAKTAPQPLTGDPMIDAQYAKGRPQDRLLWIYRASAAAMRRGQYVEARRMLDMAVVELGGPGRQRQERPQVTRCFQSGVAQKLLWRAL